LETAQAAAEASVEATAAEAKSKSRPSRKPLAAHLPREVVTHHPEQNCCPDCGEALRNFGEDVAEILEYIPANFKYDGEGTFDFPLAVLDLNGDGSNDGQLKWLALVDDFRTFQGFEVS